MSNNRDQVADQVITLFNQNRQLAGLPALKKHTKVMNAAYDQAYYQNSINTMTHTGRGGSDVGQRIRNVGYAWRWAGECVAVGAIDPQHVVAVWMNSPQHRAIILSRQAVHVGVAQVGAYWCADFASGGSDSTESPFSLW